MVVVAERKIKTGKCCHCKQITNNRVGLKWACDFDHAILFTQADKAKKLLRVRQNERKEIASAKERIKPLSKWLSEAQTAVNSYVRIRDSSLPCISCGCVSAGQWDCGHYRSRAAASHLRFHLNNMARQCSVCNQHKSGNAIEFRIGLIKRIGVAAVEELENDNSTKRWSIEECKEIKAHYSALTRELLRRLDDNKV